MHRRYNEYFFELGFSSTTTTTLQLPAALLFALLCSLCSLLLAPATK
jgi:hypothetical protein